MNTCNTEEQVYWKKHPTAKTGENMHANRSKPLPIKLTARSSLKLISRESKNVWDWNPCCLMPLKMLYFLKEI